MLIIQKPTITIRKVHTCEYHKRNPHNRNWPGCTCSSSYMEKVKPEEEWTEEEKRKYYGYL